MRIYVGRDEAGRVRHRHVTVEGTKRAAQRELTRLVAEQDRSPAVVPAEESRVWGPTTTINDAIKGWRDNGWDDLSPSTIRRYESMWKVHIHDSIGRRRIASLGPYDIERYFRELKGAGLSEASVRQTRAVLHRSCRLARKWSGNVLPNPVADTELPNWKLSELGPAVRAPSTEEVRALLAEANRQDLRMAGFVRLVAATGMRRGEVCALRWADVDWETGCVRVDESIVATKGGASVKGPKNRSSIRSVAVDTGTLDQLRKLRTDREALAGTCEVAIPDDGFVFSAEPDQSVPPHPDSMSHAFAELRSRAGIANDVHLHSLRHFQSTELDPVISEAQKQSRLGWATVHMARHYTDSVSEEDRRAADHMGKVLG
ncbi:MAG: tyrosine-type recombinase/integrase [Acidimicrobiales bacterium]